MSGPLRALIVEDSPDDADLMIRELKRGGYLPACKRVETSDDMGAALRGAEWDVVLADYSLPKLNAIEALRILHEVGMDLPFIVVSGSIGEEVAVAAMRAGAHDYLMKDKLARLCTAVEREVREARSRREKVQTERALQRSEEQFARMFHASPIPVCLTTLDGGRIFDASTSFE